MAGHGLLLGSFQGYFLCFLFGSSIFFQNLEPDLVKNCIASRRERVEQLQVEKLVRRDLFSAFQTLRIVFFDFFRVETSIFGPKLGCKLFPRKKNK